MAAGGIGSRKGKGPTKWEGPPAAICLAVCPSGYKFLEAVRDVFCR